MSKTSPCVFITAVLRRVCLLLQYYDVCVYYCSTRVCLLLQYYDTFICVCAPLRPFKA
jgi:hypothetical protein